MKLFYKIEPSVYREALDKIKAEFGMHEEIDEARTTLLLDDEKKIEQVSGTFNPREDNVVQIRVVLVDKSLKGFFDSVLGEPYKVK